jgi:S1-C subfamily serine protease
MKKNRARTMATTLAMALAAVPAMAACGSRTPESGQPGEVIEEPAAPAELAEETAPAAGGATQKGPRRNGEVARADLNRVLDAGPGAFLGRAEVKARLVKGQFRGWQVVRAPYTEIDLVPGDVVLAVNGRALEHPVDLERLWSDLRAANAIDVDVERSGQRFAIRFAVVPPL